MTYVFNFILILTLICLLRRPQFTSIVIWIRTFLFHLHPFVCLRDVCQVMLPSRPFFLKRNNYFDILFSISSHKDIKLATVTREYPRQYKTTVKHFMIAKTGEDQWKEGRRNTDGLGDSWGVLQQTDNSGALWWRRYAQTCVKRIKVRQT